MIIDKDGNIVVGQMWWSGQGVLVKDEECPFEGKEFSIGIPFDDQQKQQYLEICKYKSNLSNTDYKALKFADGALTEEEYAPVREQRAQWRLLINELEKDFHPPTITREEMTEAERKAIEKMNKMYGGDLG